MLNQQSWLVSVVSHLMSAQIVDEVFVPSFLCQGWLAQLGLHWHWSFGYGWFGIALLMVLCKALVQLLPVIVLLKTDAVSSLKFRLISAHFINVQEGSSDITLFITFVSINTLWLPISAGIWVFFVVLNFFPSPKQ